VECHINRAIFLVLVVALRSLGDLVVKLAYMAQFNLKNAAKCLEYSLGLAGDMMINSLGNANPCIVWLYNN
jgi:hypothetical protein